MKRLFPVIAIALAAGACHFGGKAETLDAGPEVDRNYQVGAFDRIEVGGPYEVRVRTGGQPGVTAHGGEAVLAETEVVVENGVLKIKPKKRNFNWRFNDRNKVSLDVTTAALRGAAIAGSGGIQVDRVTGGDFKGEVAGSGDLSVDSIEGGAVSLAIAGSGNVRAAGKASNVEVSIAGSGDVDAAALQAATASVSIAGSGNVRANASDTADVSIVGSGDVEMTGGAKCSVNKQGSGDVRCS